IESEASGSSTLSDTVCSIDHFRGTDQLHARMVWCGHDTAHSPVYPGRNVGAWRNSIVATREECLACHAFLQHLWSIMGDLPWRARRSSPYHHRCSRSICRSQLRVHIDATAHSSD